MLPVVALKCRPILFDILYELNKCFGRESGMVFKDILERNGGAQMERCAAGTREFGERREAVGLGDAGDGFP